MPGRFLSLVKPRIVALLTLTGVSALLAAGGTTVEQTLGFIAAGGLIAGGSAALNCWYDRDIDRRMERTADRPLATGKLPSHHALAFACCLLVGGTAIGLLTLPPIAVGYMWLGVTAYVGLYTIFLKRRSRLGVVLGGSAGAFPVLAGWTTVRPLAPAALAVGTLVFVWTPAHAWALAHVYRDDFAVVDIPTVPAVSSPETTARAVWGTAVGTATVGVLIGPLAGFPYRVVALVSTPLFLLAYWQYYRKRTPSAAVWAFFVSNWYLAVLCVAWAVGGLNQSPLTGALTAGAAIASFAWLGTHPPSLRGQSASVAMIELPSRVIPDWRTNVFGRIVSSAGTVRTLVRRIGRDR